jgi:hypothetical protein
VPVPLRAGTFRVTMAGTTGGVTTSKATTIKLTA